MASLMVFTANTANAANEPCFAVVTATANALI